MKSYSDLIQEVYREINNLRTDPTTFSSRFEAELTAFKANNAKHRRGAVPVMTREGMSAAEEALIAIKKATPLENLHWSEGLAHAAQAHCNDTGALGIVGHIGSRENTLQDRLEKFGKWSDCIAEALDYGSIDGFEVVLSFLVDDGLKTRPHRNALLNPRFKRIGVGMGPHSEYKTVASVVFAGEFTDKDEIEPVEVPTGGISTINEVENWLEGAIKMTCEIRSETENGVTIKKIKKYWEMGDGSTQITEEVIDT
ncbi:hypothetical protein SteCoe_11710 [Stentor coeruleus]|uniref:SCP domain-containing protein n=1 Tax=Stentor coeruleus TaxID=5963 RepID=A0A1R2CCH0_9CILI|nr:hypothetical protein SteCoe_11710 [Stentor coeruleus]